MLKSRTATLVMKPNVPPMTWEEFYENTLPYSVAIDGYVKTGPRFQDIKQGGPRANLNHHEEVDRFPTRATCAQALLDIRTGFFDTFQKDGKPYVVVYANDCDQDVCTTWFLFKYGWKAKNVINPLLNRLVFMEDMLDTTGGAYPFPVDMPVLGELAWIFEPYTEFRLNGGLKKFRDSMSFLVIVEQVEHRIMRHLHGEGESISLDTRYEKIGGGDNWVMVREHGAQARTGMLSEGIKAFVSVREESGSYNFSIGRMSNKIPFYIEDHLQNLTNAESDSALTWGGGNTIGGSNRELGSGLTPKQVEEIINKAIAIG